MKDQRFLSLLTLALAAGAPAGCDPGAEDPGVDAGPAQIANPATCSELQHNDPSLPDAEYTLFVRNEASKPWRARCEGMSGDAPREFLPLKRTGGNDNFSEVVAHGATESRIRTSYSKVRIDPVMMRIDVGDRTHATSTGSATVAGQVITGVALGVSAYCFEAPVAPFLSIEDRRAVGNIDLGGTGFALDDGFCVFNSLNGTAELSSDKSRIDLYARRPSDASVTGCAWVAPEPCPVDPWQPTTSGTLLDIVYSP